MQKTALVQWDFPVCTPGNTKLEVWVAKGASEKTGVMGEQKPVLASSGDLSYVTVGQVGQRFGQTVIKL